MDQKSDRPGQNHSQLVVLGGGPAGYTAAFMAADRGMDVTLVDAAPRLGGTCLLDGCIPSKALLHVARVMSEASAIESWGVRYEPPVVDLDRMRTQKDKIIAALSGGLGQLAKRRKVRVIEAHGFFEHSRRLRLESQGDDEGLTQRRKGAKGGGATERANGATGGAGVTTLSFEHCIVAVGSRPAVPEGLALPSERVMDSTAALNLPDVPERLLVIGGGYIGLELGTVYAQLGSRVTVVEMTGGLLPGVDRDLVGPLEKFVRRRMENVFLSTRVVGLSERSGTRIVAEFARNSQPGCLPGEATSNDAPPSDEFDRVLVAVGRRPNSDRIGLENTGVEIDERGFVKVDARRHTADSSILAVGDVAGEPMLAHKAAAEAKAAVAALCGDSATFLPAAIPAVVFTDPEIAWAGLTQQAAEAEGRLVEIGVFPWAASGRAHAVGRTEGLTKLVIEPESGRILGVGIVGAGAGELIAEGVHAITMGACARDLAKTIHAHPTLSETLGLAAESYLGIATEIYRPKRNR